MNDVSIDVCQAANDEDIRFFRARMAEFWAPLLPPENNRPIVLFLRDAQGSIVGGLLGTTRFNTLYIDELWVADAYHHQGYGRQLMEMAEQQAVHMGCLLAAVGTFEISGARVFYEKLGYRLMSITENSPCGHIGYWFNKDLG